MVTRSGLGVLPMYMGVILERVVFILTETSAPHVYGGDPYGQASGNYTLRCSPCIWG